MSIEGNATKEQALDTEFFRIGGHTHSAHRIFLNIPLLTILSAMGLKNESFAITKPVTIDPEGTGIVRITAYEDSFPKTTCTGS